MSTAGDWEYLGEYIDPICCECGGKERLVTCDYPLSAIERCGRKVCWDKCAVLIVGAGERYFCPEHGKP